MSKARTETVAQQPADVAAISKRLKEIMRAEIEKLPALLEQLPPTERAKALLELMPYCAPKLDKAAPDFGEGFAVW